MELEYVELSSNTVRITKKNQKVVGIETCPGRLTHNLHYKSKLKTESDHKNLPRQDGSQHRSNYSLKRSTLFPTYAGQDLPCQNQSAPQVPPVGKPQYTKRGVIMTDDIVLALVGIAKPSFAISFGSESFSRIMEIAH